ncbi:threonylcarbamoyl-AMP synthase [Patescibacteria group bacterium]|nr:threonylcarbamoyl-AMP synthase [Patescibacteria group bacterium]
MNQKNFKDATEIVIGLIKEGKVIIFPTDTVYIPVADATNKKAVRKVFQIKQRSQKTPFPIFVKDIKMAKKFARIDKTQEKFLKTVWPGKITVVLKRRKTKTKLYGVAKDTIALRIPDFKPVNLLSEKLKIPLVGTSANISGKPASGNLKKILSQLRNKEYQPDLVIDAGNLPKSKPSTVLDLTTLPPKILRP